jgi:hypothetical protein
MLVVLALLAGLQAPPRSAAAPSEDPIVIVANRLDRVRFNLSVNRLTGEMKCTLARSSGEPAVDAYMCETARYCARTSRKTRAAIEQCITGRKQAYLARYRQGGAR